MEDGRLIALPVSEMLYAVTQVALRLIFGINKYFDVDFGQFFGQDVPQVSRELVFLPESRFTPLVYENALDTQARHRRRRCTESHSL